jgi:hypothetical protein
MDVNEKTPEQKLADDFEAAKKMAVEAAAKAKADKLKEDEDDDDDDDDEVADKTKKVWDSFNPIID